MQNGRRLVAGADIGTTSISTVVLDPDRGELIAARSVPNDASLTAGNGPEREQDAVRIFEKTKELLDGLLDGNRDIVSIGLTGQMHGIVLLSGEGELLSPLATWQDGRAAAGDPSACDLIREKTGYEAMPGYGLATFYADLRAGRVPERTAKICTIADYFGMKLVGRSAPLIHTGNAASFGLFDLSAMRFDTEKVKLLGIDPSILPQSVPDARRLGTYRGIPVSAAIGDNQAAFFGSVSDPAEMVLANFGTGSQVSLAVTSGEAMKTGRSVEMRPFDETRMLASGSALCGGRAYAILERFFRLYTEAAGGGTGSGYDILNRLALEAMDRNERLPVRTAFCGTRDDPDLRGMIGGISEDNFTPGALAAGVLYGMAEELYGMFLDMPGASVRTLVLAGNAARKNPALRRAAAQVFGMRAVIPACREEAAFGAALWSLRALGEPVPDSAIRYTKVPAEG